VATYFAGEQVDIVVIKNQDHFNAANPGNFSAFLWNGSWPHTAAVRAASNPSHSPPLHPRRARSRDGHEHVHRGDARHERAVADAL